MNVRLIDHGGRGMLSAFTRTRFFHGQLLEAHHLEDAQRYQNEKRQLLNRLVVGYGVVAGMKVEVDQSGSRLVVAPGLALDRAGREIVVPRPALSEAVAPRPNGPDAKPRPDEHCHEDADWVHVVICFHECLADPERAYLDACGCEAECEYGAVRERFEIRIEEGRAKGPSLECSIRDAIVGGRIRYDEIVNWVTMRRLEVPVQTCITLANVLRPAEYGCIKNSSIDMNVRPVVYGNDLLFELICGLVTEDADRPRGSKL